MIRKLGHLIEDNWNEICVTLAIAGVAFGITML